MRFLVEATKSLKAIVMILNLSLPFGIQLIASNFESFFLPTKFKPEFALLYRSNLISYFGGSRETGFFFV